MLSYSKTTTITAIFILLVVALLVLYNFTANEELQSDNSQSTHETQTTKQDEVTAETPDQNVGIAIETRDQNDDTTTETSDQNDDTTTVNPDQNGDTTAENPKEADRGFDPCLINNKLPVCTNNENSNNE